jgi:carboxymethylenebutenolidase
MRATEVRIPAGDGTIPGSFAQPGDNAPAGGRPGIVVLHEVLGLAPEIVAVVERFADRGWAAVAPDLFSHGTRVGCLVSAMANVNKGRLGPFAGDIEAARQWLAAQPGVDPDRLAVIGFCLGGSFALLYAADAPDGFRAAAVNYGNVPKRAERLEGACPIVASYGARDMLYGKHGDRLEHHLTELGVEHDVKTYPNAGHSFVTEGHHPVSGLLFFPLRAKHVPDASADAWERIFAFLDDHVVSPTT